MPERLLAYTDKLSAEPGDLVEVMVSSPRAGTYRAQLVRLICGDDSPGGPGFKTQPVASLPAHEYPARHQPIPCGSYIEIDDRQSFALPSFSVRCFIWPTWLDKGSEQCILGNWDAASRTGYALHLDSAGRLALRIGDQPPLVLPHDLLARHWYMVAAAFDATTGRAILATRRLMAYGRSGQRNLAEGQLAPSAVSNRFLIAAWNQGKKAAAHFNGKIDSPAVFGEALKAEALLAFPGTRDEPPPERAVADWDFSQDTGGTWIIDSSRYRRNGHTVNLPTRAMTGWNWDGAEMNWKRKPEQYGAIHFHDDDLYDCAWATDFSLRLPKDLKSGIYCIHLVQGDLEEFTPLFVRPPKGKPTAPLAFLVPTASYLAYANQQMDTSWHFDELSSARFTSITRTDQFLEETYSLGLSTYDLHGDGSGVCHSSRLRPILNMRPKGELWQFNADTHITDWLAAKGFDCDIITDEDLESEGLDCLKPYRCVLTGTHPEYYSLKMLDAVQYYTDRGGRLVYLGANGFYWRIAWHPALPGVIEHRRSEAGMRAWFTESGESYMAFTGEYSGLWRRNGRPPNVLVGTGFAAQGFDFAGHYDRMPDSRNPRAAFIFEGVPDGKIGDFGTIGGGAAGWEIDRADAALGSPPHALIVATASDFPASYHWVSEELNHTHSAVNGDTCPMVKADMVFFETPQGGGVFSVSSISWAGALAHNGYDNNVSRITENVVRRFLDPKPL
ncbi:MAG TPA: N,N-dimethylformamidase beta subunit family domain-containing protein [Dongiaceae bacterium]|nr:N,N-dimethylformamidase beta subunit family domain-containing protein [Dongiaceae bacterium]